MKKMIAMLLALAMLLCGAALAEAGEGNEAQISCAIEEGAYVIRIPDKEGDLGWLADDMSQDPSVVKLASAGLEGDEYVVRYEAVGDGEMTVEVKHYIGIACDQVHGWTLLVRDGAVRESTGGYYTACPDAAEQDPYLLGQWVDAGAGLSVLTVSKNETRGWDIEIEGAMARGAYVFKTTMQYDCALDAFVYDKGKFWEVPITDSEEAPELGEAKLAGTAGTFVVGGEEKALTLTWYDDQTPENITVFKPMPPAPAIDFGTSKRYTEAEMEEAINLIEMEFATWDGCELHNVRYAGDELASEENLKYVNTLKDGAKYADVIVFLSDFHSPVEGGGAWEADKEYTDWQWFLAREAGGAWELLTWGY